jgi:two-component system LytT family response regulator
MQRPYTCIIVDDEQEAIELLASLINEYCPEIQIVATVQSSAEAKKYYFKFLPDLIFMDIEVDEKNGFDILKDIYRDKLKPTVVFVTAFNQYAIDAFKANAIGYLLKPVDLDDLKHVVRKFSEEKERDIQYKKITALIEGHPNKIRFNTRAGFILLDVRDILYCEAERNYTKIYKTYNRYEMISANLLEVEKKLDGNGFWRVNRSYLVNSDYVSEVDRKQKKCIISYHNNEIEIPASPKMIRKL